MKLKVPMYTGHKLHNRIKFQGLQISVENEMGTVRSGENWQTVMQHKYGYIRGTIGSDGDHLDVYVGPHKFSKDVFVVFQVDPRTGEYDEDKVMLGYESPEEAKAAYLLHYDTDKFFGSMGYLPLAVFKAIISAPEIRGRSLSGYTTMVKSKAGDSTVLTFKSKQKDGTLMMSGDKWYVFSKGKPHPIKLSSQCVKALTKDERGSMRKSEAPKRYFSPDEVKARGMRWVTIRGARVLLQGTEDGGWVVVGGAEGSLNHFKIDKIEDKETYQRRQTERKQEADRRMQEVEGLSYDDIKEMRKQERERLQARKKAREEMKTEYKSRVEDALGSKIEDLLTDEDRKMFARKAAERVTGERTPREEGEAGEPRETAESREITQRKIQQEIEISEKAAARNKLKDLEVQATNLLAQYYEGTDKNPTVVMSVGEQEVVMDVEGAKAILGAKKGLNDAMKAVNQKYKNAIPTIEKDALKVGEVFAGADDYTEEEIASQIRRNIETAKNIQFYDEINAHHDRVAKHIENGAARSLNGIMSDVYESGAHFSEELVRTLGVDAIARAIAHKLTIDGKKDVAAKALKEYSDRVREKTVDKAMQQAQHAYQEKDRIHANAKGEDAVFSKAQANAFSIRWYAHAYNNLGSAAGSLRAMAHVIAALDDPPNEIIRKHMGRDRVAIAKKMADAGLTPGMYSIKKDKDTGQFMVEIPSESLTPFFEKTEEQVRINSRRDAIKMHKANTGQIASGVKEGNKWGFNPKTGKVDPKLAAAQEAGYRFAAETDKSLLAFDAGIGKTFVASNLISDAMTNKGAKKILVAVPAGMKDESSAEYRKFLDDALGEQVRTSNQKWTPERRRALYEENGIHVVSHDALRNDRESIHGQNWDMIIADEVHDLVNAKQTEFGAKSFESLAELAQKSGKVTAMTGTPIKTDKREMWKVARLTGNNAALGRMKDFEARHKDINQSTSAFAASETESFRREIAPFTYAQGYTIDAKKTETRIDANMTPEQRRETKRIMAEYKEMQERGAQGASGRRDIELWKVSNLQGGRNNPKFRKLAEDAREFIDASPSNKGLVFLSQGASKGGADQYAKQLEQEFGKGSAAAITGSTSAARMRQLKAQYKDPNSPLKFLVGNESLSTGHNLQSGSRIWKVDTPVSKAQDDQQNARAHRNGQTQDVDVRYLQSDNPNDINKRYLFEKKGREAEIMGNPNHVDGKEGSGFGSLLRHYERDMRGV